MKLLVPALFAAVFALAGSSFASSSAPAPGEPSSTVEYIAALSGATPDRGPTVSPPLAMEGTTILSGYPSESPDGIATPGVVFVHHKRTGAEEWALQQKIFKPEGTSASAQFGSAIALKDGIAWIGASRATDAGGRVYEYRVDAFTGMWTATGRSVAASVPVAGERFGATLAFDGSFLAVGAPMATVSNRLLAGAVDLFDAATLAFIIRIPDQQPGFPGNHFGTYLALGDGFLAAAGMRMPIQTWTRSGNTWSRTANITGPPPGDAVTDFGAAITASGDRIFIGTGGGPAVARVYVYRRDNGTDWLPVANIPSPAPSNRTDGYGSSLAVHGSLLAMGIPSSDITLGATANRLWLLRNTEGQTWTPVAPAVLPPEDGYSRYADSVALTDRYLVATHSGGSDNLGGVIVHLHNPAGNLPPAFTSIPLIFAEAGTEYTHRLSAVDEDSGDTLTFSAAGPLPAWLSLTDHGDGRATLSGTPPAGSSGDNAIALKASDTAGAAARQWFTLKVVPAGAIPRITFLSPDQSVSDSRPVELSVTIAPGDPVTYQWYLNGTPLPGETGARLLISSAQVSNSGRYHVRITRGGVWVDSAAVNLTVTQVPDRFGGDWPTLGAGPSHSGAYPATLGRHTFLPAWSMADASHGQVATGNGRVYTTGYVFPAPNATVAAFDLQSGRRLWSTNFPSGASINPPTYYRGRVYMQRGALSTEHPDVRAFDAATGANLWVANYASQGNFHYAPAVNDSGVFVNGGGFGGIYGFSLDGAQLFFTDLEQFDQWTPLLHAGKVYSWVATSFREHDPRSGGILNTLTLPGLPPTGHMATVAAAEGTTAVMRTRTTLSAVDLAVRTIRWTIANSFTGSPAISRGVVYAIRDGAVESRNALTGVPGVVYPTRDAQDLEVTAVHQPVVLDDTFLVSSDDTVWIFDLVSGTLLQRLNGGGPLTYTDGVLLAVDDRHTLRTWKVRQPASLSANPAPPVIPPDGSAVNYAVAPLFSDPDPGEVLTYSIAGVDHPELFRTLSVDAATGQLRAEWTPYAWGTAAVTVRATGQDELTQDTLVTLTIDAPPAPAWSLDGAAVVNRQTGLVEQRIRVRNTGPRALAGFNLDLTTSGGTALYNGLAATPNSAGSWTLPYNVPLAAGEEITLVLEFYSPGRQADFQVSATRVVDPLAPAFVPPPAAGTPFSITRAAVVTGGVLIEFPSEPGVGCRIEYSPDNSIWTPCPVPVRAGGTSVQWIDRGPPFTSSAPAGTNQRFYRIRRL